jgi:GxxExxY protein
MEIELGEQGFRYRRQVPQPVSYRGRPLRVGYRLDFVVEEQVIVELKAVEKLLKVHKAQLITYMKLSGIKKGLLINFNEAFLTDGVQRAIL